MRRPQGEDHLIRKRMGVLFLVCVLVASAILFRAVQVQIIGDKRLQNLAKSQFNKRHLIRPRRGVVLDRNGEPLAINIETKSLVANSKKIRNKREVARVLARILRMSEAQLFRRLSRAKSFVWIKRHMSSTEAEQILRSRLGADGGELTEGLWMVKESRRDYPHGSTAGQVLGAVNIDTDGIEGTELWFNERLRGGVVSMKALKDALGRPTFIDADAAGKVKDGEPVTLTIDIALQHAVEDELKNALERTRSSAGTAIVMDASSGEILALANQPTFDPNGRSQVVAHRRNRALTDSYEPGSVIKPLLVAAALNKGLNLNSTLWGGMGSMTLAGKTISEAESHEKFGWVSIKKAIQVSSNVATARLALDLGQREVLGILDRFGFGEKPGTGFPGEISGKLPSEQKLHPLTLANMGFGQGFVATSLQVARAYSAILNGGWLLQPKLILNPSQEQGIRPPKKILTKKVTDQITETLLAATSAEGTGSKAVLPGYRVAGKTGTAQTVDPQTKRYSTNRYLSSFVGFAVDVKPKLVIFVSLDGPRGIYYASETAAPLFQQVLAAVVNRFGIPPTEKIIPLAKAEPKKDEIKIEMASPVPPIQSLEKKTDAISGKSHWVMPDLKGLSALEALRLFEGTGIQISAEGNGRVVHQRPMPGTPMVEQNWVRMTLKD